MMRMMDEIELAAVMVSDGAIVVVVVVFAIVVQLVLDNARKPISIESPLLFLLHFFSILLLPPHPPRCCHHCLSLRCCPTSLPPRTRLLASCASGMSRDLVIKRYS